MDTIKYFVVDAFTEKLFKGNPAGVCLLDKPLDDDTMQNIAAENNLPETAFVLRTGDGYHLRWFTPEVEIDLCGHTTLAAAFVLTHHTKYSQNAFVFHTISGALTVTRNNDLYELDFPSRNPSPIPVTLLMERAIGVPVLEAGQARDLILLVESEDQVRKLQINMEALKSIPDCFAVIVTARGMRTNFVSRFFAPGAGIMEDPVTGAAHCSLIPFWSKRTGKKRLVAAQLSKRGGILYCEDRGERVKMAGHAVLYLEGVIKL